jgi:SAM-dependent methyltransferase
MPSVLRRWEEVLDKPLPESVWVECGGREKQSIVLLECPECGFGRFEPVVPGTAGFYQSISSVDYYNADKWEFACAGAELKATGAKRILDVGCGSGIFLDYLKRTIPGADLFGFDLNAELLDQLANRGFEVFPHTCDNFDKASAAEKTQFDAIAMLQVLEHASEPITFLKSFLRLLRPGGLLILTTPNSAGPIRKFPDALTELPPHHLTRWTERSFRALLPAHGLAIRCVMFEPLPDYLWDAYLPKLWDEPIWPAMIFDPIARARGLMTVGERSALAAKAMKRAGIRFLYGVGGHTIYVSGCLKVSR